MQLDRSGEKETWDRIFEVPEHGANFFLLSAIHDKWARSAALEEEVGFSGVVFVLTESFMLAARAKSAEAYQ